MERRITVRDIAKALGCHYTTVSLALRDDPRLPEKTRRRAQEAARKMGYRPDPMVQALSAYRTSVKAAADHGTIAWLSNEAMPQLGKQYHFGRYADGAIHRASELGYQVEEFVLRAPGMTARRMVQILQARGIKGIIVAPQPLARMRARIRMDWTPFSAITIGYSLAWPPLHVVANNQFNTAKTACRKLNSLGYRRIGFCFDKIVAGRSNGTFLGGYLAESARWPDAQQIKPLLYEKWDGPAYKAWFRANKPEAIIFSNSADIELAMAELPYRVPDDVGMVCLGETDKGYASVHQNSHEVGIAAIDLLVSMMYRNERGVPAIPRRLLIEGTWQDGSTACRINLPRVAKPRAAKSAPKAQGTGGGGGVAPSKTRVPKRSRR